MPPGQASIEKKAPPVLPVQAPKPKGVKASPYAAGGPAVARGGTPAVAPEPEPLVTPPVLARGELKELRRLQQDVLGTGRAAGVGLEGAADFLNPAGPVADPVPEPGLAEEPCRRLLLARPSHRPRQ